ncbi:MAG: hypothetical protein HZB41_15440 [Ignavibacteriae bacterium]|nr:hypothetical protein [Ignavibacteriota bacterium]
MITYSDNPDIKELVDEFEELGKQQLKFLEDLNFPIRNKTDLENFDKIVDEMEIHNRRIEQNRRKISEKFWNHLIYKKPD